MQVLVTGATGYIGSVVAEALIGACHRVLGTARTGEKRALLAARGIDGRLADLTQPGALAALAREAGGVIHTALAWSPETGAIDRAAVSAMLDAIEKTNKPFVYTSGVWVMGDTGGKLTAEVKALHPPEIVAWRPQVEDLVHQATWREIRGIVIRPAMVYGRGGGFVAAMVKQAREQGLVRIAGDGTNHWSFVHVEDLAQLYVLALEKAPAGDIFIGVDGPPLAVRTVAEAASRAGGAGGKVVCWPLEEARRELGPMAGALVMDQTIGTLKAVRELGWIPRRPSVLEELRAPRCG